jgi:hypothetical protein
MDLFKDVLSQIKDVQDRLSRLESSNQVQKIAASSGAIILNQSGLVSSINFPRNQITGGPTTTTSTSYVDVPGSSMNPFTTTAASTSALITVITGGYNVNWASDGSTILVQVVDSVNGNIISYPIVGNWELTDISQDGTQAITGWSTNWTQQLVTIPAVIPLNAGTHTLKLQYKVNGTGTAHLSFFLLGYIILGQQV